MIKMDQRMIRIHVFDFFSTCLALRMPKLMLQVASEPTRDVAEHAGRMDALQIGHATWMKGHCKTILSNDVVV